MALLESLTCSRCGTRHAVEAKFCDACGAGLDTTLESEPRPQPPPQLAEKIRSSRLALEGERKQVTVLFADVTGSMDLAEQVDPEEWTRIMDRFFTILTEGVHRFEGTVDKFTGDGIMALFGAPIAHEDHAQRACYAALHLQRPAGRPTPRSCAARRASASPSAWGSTRARSSSGRSARTWRWSTRRSATRSASRSEWSSSRSRARSTSPQDTATLVGGYFALEDLGEFQVKGASAAARPRADRDRRRARRLDVSRARGFSRFVGRTDEVRALESALRAGARGRAAGDRDRRRSRGREEPAVPRVRSARARERHARLPRVRPRPHEVRAADARARVHAGVLRRDRAGLATRRRASGSRASCSSSTRRFAEDLPLMFDFLAVPDPERPAPRMDPEARQRQLLRLIKRLTRAAERARAAASTCSRTCTGSTPRARHSSPTTSRRARAPAA